MEPLSWLLWSIEFKTQLCLLGIVLTIGYMIEVMAYHTLPGFIREYDPYFIKSWVNNHRRCTRVGDMLVFGVFPLSQVFNLCMQWIQRDGLNVIECGMLFAIASFMALLFILLPYYQLLTRGRRAKLDAVATRAHFLTESEVNCGMIDSMIESNLLHVAYPENLQRIETKVHEAARAWRLEHNVAREIAVRFNGNFPHLYFVWNLMHPANSNAMTSEEIAARKREIIENLLK